LQRVEDFAFAADQLVQVLTAVDAYHRPIPLDIEIDVAVEVEQVQELFQVVAGDLAFGDQALLQVLAGGRILGVFSDVLLRSL
jgi:hypothetical protein